jgi:hypothetical protein
MEEVMLGKGIDKNKLHKKCLTSLSFKTASYGVLSSKPQNHGYAFLALQSDLL